MEYVVVSLVLCLAAGAGISLLCSVFISARKLTMASWFACFFGAILMAAIVIVADQVSMLARQDLSRVTFDAIGLQFASADGLLRLILGIVVGLVLLRMIAVDYLTVQRGEDETQTRVLAAPSIHSERLILLYFLAMVFLSLIGALSWDLSIAGAVVVVVLPGIQYFRASRSVDQTV